MFPAQEEFEVDMICTKTFICVECHSLDGLVVFLRTCIPTISEHDAMLYLLKSNAKLCKAIAMAEQEGHDTSNWDFDAYKAAADTAWHPEPDAHVEFAMESLPVVRSAVKSLLQARRTHSSNEILCLSRLLSLSKSYPAKSLWPTVELRRPSRSTQVARKNLLLIRASFMERSKLHCRIMSKMRDIRMSFVLSVV